MPKIKVIVGSKDLEARARELHPGSDVEVDESLGEGNWRVLSDGPFTVDDLPAGLPLTSTMRLRRLAGTIVDIDGGAAVVRIGAASAPCCQGCGVPLEMGGERCDACEAERLRFEVTEANKRQLVLQRENAAMLEIVDALGAMRCPFEGVDLSGAKVRCPVDAPCVVHRARGFLAERGGN